MSTPPNSETLKSLSNAQHKELKLRKLYLSSKRSYGINNPSGALWDLKYNSPHDKLTQEWLNACRAPTTPPRVRAQPAFETGRNDKEKRTNARQSQRAIRDDARNGTRGRAPLAALRVPSTNKPRQLVLGEQLKENHRNSAVVSKWDGIKEIL